MIKKTLSLLLVVIILIGVFIPINVFAETNQSNDVPVITFTTADGNGTALKKSDGYINAAVSIKDVDGAELTDKIVMKVRGNSTAFDSIGKKSYTFKFGSKKNVLHMGSGKKWALVSNVFDPTLARNYIAFSLAKELGIQYTSEFKVVEVVVDGSFRGCYLLFEPVGDGKDRVDIDTSSNNGKKDFLLELESSRKESDVTYFKTNGIRFAVSEPDPPSDEQLDYIQSTMDGVISTIINGSQEDIESKIDTESFVKYYLLNEFLKTVDFNFSSVFYYYKDGKLYAGPPWDYDLSSGNVNESYSSWYASSYKTDGLFINNYNLYKWLCSKEWFNDSIKRSFTDNYPCFAEIASDGGMIDSFYSTYKDVINRNFTEAGWRENGYYVNVMKKPLATYAENFDFYKNWCGERVEWLREYFGVEPIPTESTQVTDVTEPTHVTEPTTPAPIAKISKTKASVKAGRTVTLKVTNGTVKTWSSSNKKVAAVSKGKVTGLKKGSAIITATTTTGKKLTCKVTVTTSPKLSKKSVTVKKGKTVSVKITGKASTVKNVYTNTKYAKIISAETAAKIKVKGLRKGKTTLKVKVNGVVLKLKVKVK